MIDRNRDDEDYEGEGKPLKAKTVEQMRYEDAMKKIAAYKVMKKNPNNLLDVKYKGFVIRFTKVKGRISMNDRVYAYVYTPEGKEAGTVPGSFMNKYQAFGTIRKWIDSYIARSSSPASGGYVSKHNLHQYARSYGLDGQRLEKFVRLMRDFYPQDAEKIESGHDSNIGMSWIDRLKADEEYVFANKEQQYLFYRIDGKDTIKKFITQYKHAGYPRAAIIAQYWNPFARYVKSMRS